jgi:hypothetical protein
MERLSRQLGDYNDKLSKHIESALPEFRYEGGYTLSASDLGKLGVKIEMNNQFDSGVAIILPPEKVGEYGMWLLQTLEQEDKGTLKEFLEIIERLTKQKGNKLTLQRGDKTKLKNVIRFFKRQSAKMWAKRPALRTLSKKAI